MSYTLQSRKNGKFISSLFADTHEDAFQALTPADAYSFYDKESLIKLLVESPQGLLEPCKIVAIPNEE